MQGGTLTLPPFRGATRRIILVYVAAFFALMILSFAFGLRGAQLIAALCLQPLVVARGHLWELLTYTFVPDGILNTAFALLTLWFCGGAVEDVRGPRYVYELFAVSVLGGGIIVTAISLLGIPQLPANSIILGAWSVSFAALVGFGTLYADQEISLFMVLRLKAKYLIAIYVLIDLALMFRPGDAPLAVAQLASGLCAYLFLRFAPRRGLLFNARESAYGLQNSYSRWKRRRAARKFEVYMRKQNREVHFDDEGRYISPEEERKNPNDRKWMN